MATLEAIVQAATQLLREDGLAAMTTNAVALRAGVSIGSLYQYFPNRDALMVELIRREQRSHVERVRGALEFCDGLGLEATVRLLVRAAMGHHRADALLASAIDHEEARLPVDAIIADTLSEGSALLAQLLSRFEDQISPIDPVRAARTLPALVRSVVDMWANLPQAEVDTAEEEAVRAVLGYLRCGSRPGG